ALARPGPRLDAVRAHSPEVGVEEASGALEELGCLLRAIRDLERSIGPPRKERRFRAHAKLEQIPGAEEVVVRKLGFFELVRIDGREALLGRRVIDRTQQGDRLVESRDRALALTVLHALRCSRP